MEVMDRWMKILSTCIKLLSVDDKSERLCVEKKKVTDSNKQVEGFYTFGVQTNGELIQHD